MTWSGNLAGMQSEEPSELNLRDYLRVVWGGKWIILGLTLLVTVAAVVASLAQTPVYQGKAEVLLQAKASESLFDPNSGVRNDPARAIQTEIQVLRSRPVRDLVRDKIGDAPKVAASAVGQTDVLEVRAESTDAERAALIANTYANAYIEFRRTQAVDDLLAAAEQIQQKITDLQARIDGVAAPSTSTTERGVTTTTTSANADALRQRESLQQQQALFRQKLDELQVDAALKSGGAQLVTPAVAPTVPIRPTPLRNAALALVVGLMLGVGVAFLREYLDDSLKGKDDVEQAAPGVPVLGLIPELKTWKDQDAAVLVSIAEPQSPAAEAYRGLRTSVQFLGLDRSIKIIQMTSPSQAEGKSTTIANLAVGLAGAGQRVVLVDADLRRPRIHEFFGLGQDVGLTSILVGDAQLTGALQHVSGVPRLYVLASGPIPPNPSEMLGSERMAELLRSLAEHADVVLIDCPPVLPVTDARVLSHRIDATLVVVSAGSTKQAQLRRAVELLGQVEAPLLGIVINGVSDASAYGYGYGGSYRYAYAADDRKRGVAPAERNWTVAPPERTQAAEAPVESVAQGAAEASPEPRAAMTPDTPPPATRAYEAVAPEDRPAAPVAPAPTVVRFVEPEPSRPTATPVPRAFQPEERPEAVEDPELSYLVHRAREASADEPDSVRGGVEPATPRSWSTGDSPDR